MLLDRHFEYFGAEQEHDVDIQQEIDDEFDGQCGSVHRIEPLQRNRIEHEHEPNDTHSLLTDNKARQQCDEYAMRRTRQCVFCFTERLSQSNVEQQIRRQISE